MHIKQITISNFRSFRKQPEIQPFSQGTNAVVGRNGSGKSNLFDAVQFVLLSPKFWTLRTEDRQALLHEGSGTAAVNAYVEIIFDNRDGRFQGFSSDNTNSDEIVLRRTVGSKKDEIFLQRKKTSKNEVMSLLEGAGFSKSNPYFIVQQGKVNALCVMKDTERLELLKEVAGTTVYDEKKKESQFKMKENTESMSKIQETLTYMEERLEELRGEKEELTMYQQLDRDRKALAYTLYDKELRRARETLDEIEQQKAEEAESRYAIHEQAKNAANAITTVEGKLKTKTMGLRRNKVYLKEMEEDKTAAMTLQTKLELQTKEAEENIHLHEATLTRNKHEIESLTTQITSASHTLHSEIQPKFDTSKNTLTRMTTERNACQKKMDALYAKQGRGRQFDTKEERDVYLKAQIEDLKSAQLEKENLLNEKRDALANLRRTITSGTKEVESKSVELSKQDVVLEELKKSIDTKLKDRTTLAETRNVQWGELSKVQAQVSDAKDTSRKAYSTLRKIMPRNTAMGLDSLKRILAEEGITEGTHYFGPVMDNITLVEDKFQTAVEVSAQNALFHVIVDTDATAARLMKRLEKDRLGRVTFLPLNRLNSNTNSNYPESRDVVPLLQTCLRYDKRLSRAMEHVFGQKLLADSVEAASTWSVRCNVDAVTLDGDLCSRKGALSGGYVDLSKSRLKANIDMKSSQENLRTFEAEEKNMRNRNKKTDMEISNVMSEVQRLKAQKVDLERTLTRMDEDISTQKTRQESKKKQAHTMEVEGVPPLERDIVSLDHQVKLLEEEVGTDLCETLTKEEKSLLQQLKATQAELKSNVEHQTQTLEEVSIERQRLQSLLEDNLMKRKRELEEDGAEALKSHSRRRSKDGKEQPAARVAQSQRKENLVQVQRELEEAIQNTEVVEERLAEAKEIDAALRRELNEGKKELESFRTEDGKISKYLEDAQKKDEKLMNKRSLCVTQRELHSRRIQELGTLPPSSALKKHKGLSISNLMRELERINKKLKGYSHVNKKAFDQFVNFNEQREDLLKRKDEVDGGADKVKELIESLDRQKDEAINRTFRGVSAHFKDVFKELVPNGAGELIMRTSLDEEEDLDEDLDEAEVVRRRQNPSVSRYRGVGIKVRFSPVGENYIMSQLSGGQKSLVAMALIFAIQRCDPAPFYLFDELDQALDSSYRKAVAGLIQRQANSDENPTQFICSTFRPELVAISDNCYGISHQDKVSNILSLSKRDALSFIANLMNEEEAVGEVSSLATSKATAAKKKEATNSRKRKAIESADDDEGRKTIAAA